MEGGQLLLRSRQLIVILAGFGLATFGLGSTPTASFADAVCGRFEQTTSSCPEATGTINGGGVDLSAEIGGGSGGGGQGGSGSGQRGRAAEGGASVRGGQSGGQQGAQQGQAPVGPDPIVRDGFIVYCTPGTPCDPNLVVGISDLVNFRPAVPVQGMEPNGWTLVGLPTNFFGTASTHVRTGPLLGFPAEVRFTPVGFRRDYGDGSAGSSATGGATWAAQGLPEFSETATSHVYRETGSYTITLTVEYAAEYRFAGPTWRGIRGTLAVPANPLTTVAGEAKTVLVARECTRNSGGPGC